MLYPFFDSLREEIDTLLWVRSHHQETLFMAVEVQYIEGIFTFVWPCYSKKNLLKT